ncbi:hypothetical protein CHS0354_004313, partial [Potamilus streckersoni]
MRLRPLGVVGFALEEIIKFFYVKLKAILSLKRYLLLKLWDKVNEEIYGGQEFPQENVTVRSIKMTFRTYGQESTSSPVTRVHEIYTNN